MRGEVMTGPRGTPLDLRAVEARLNNQPLLMLETRSDARALLVHCRALRAALAAIKQQAVYDSTHVLFDIKRENLFDAAAVLAQAWDGEAL